MTSCFHELVVKGMVFRGIVNAGSLDLVCCENVRGGREVGWVQMGPSWLSKQGDEWFVVKYDMSQRRISLDGFSDDEAELVGSEFGVPLGVRHHGKDVFCESPAFRSLCRWAKKHPVLFRRAMVNTGCSLYLPRWFAMVVTNLIADTTIENAKR